MTEPTAGTEDPGNRAKNKRRLGIALALTSLYLAVEVAAGFWTGSLALLADAGHMLTDVGGLALALVAIRFAERPATPEKTFGYYRVEILAAMANALILVAISAVVLYEAYRRFRNPPEVESKLMLLVAVVGLVINVMGILILRGGSSKSLNVKGAYFEILSDALTSIGVIIAAAIIWATGWRYADPLLSAGIGLFILPRTWTLLKEAVGVLLEGTPSDVNMTALREAIAKVEGVTEVHDLHVWTLTTGMNALSVHVVRDGGKDGDGILRMVRERIASGFPIGHVTVQIEAQCCPPEETHL